MKWLLLFLFRCTLPASAQKPCKCIIEVGGSVYNYIHCDTIQLKNGAKLYYQCTPNMYWLTLQQKSGGKKVLFRETEPDVFHLAGRLGYNLTREYKNALLFRWDCPANGPCTFAVVNKNTGKLLLNKEARDLFQDPYVTNTPFLLFYDAGYVHLYYLNTLRQYRILESTLRLPDAPDYYLHRLTE